MRLLDASAVSYAVVLTKRDEVKAAEQNARVEATLEALRKHVAAYPEVHLHLGADRRRSPGAARPYRPSARRAEAVPGAATAG